MNNPGFLFGGNTGLSYQDLQRRRKELDARKRQTYAPKNIGEGLTALGHAFRTRIESGALAEAEKAGQERGNSALSAFQTILSGGGSAPSGTSISGNAPSGGGSDLSGNEIYSGFMDAVRSGGVENPYALAAIAATGKAESGFSAGNANRTWSDPSQSGQPGTAGGIMSWRAERLRNLGSYAATKGETLASMTPQTQGEFFLRENPQLIEALNGAGSLEEAQSIINGAWKFAGYNQPGGEAARRLGYAQSLLPSFQSNGQPVQVASADPQQAFSLAAGQHPEQASPQQAAQLTSPVPGTSRRAAGGPMNQRIGSVDPRLFELLSSPDISPGQRSVMLLQLQRMMDMNKPMSPLQQVQLQKAQHELEQLRNPERTRAKDAAGRLRYVDDGALVFPEAEVPDKGYQMLAPEQVQELGLPEGAYQQSAAGRILQIGKPGTNLTVNTGNSGPAVPAYNKLPSGYVYKRDQSGQILIDESGVPTAVPITGGPAAIEAEKQAASQQAAQELRERGGGVVLEDIDRAVGIIENGGFFNGTGLPGSLTQGIPGTDAFALNKLLDTIKANSGFDKLQQMRDASPTGGALGQVSERELNFLQSAIGNLDQAQDQETLLHNLNRVKRIYQDIVHGPAQAEGEPSLGDLLKQYGGQ